MSAESGESMMIDVAYGKAVMVFLNRQFKNRGHVGWDK
jgi:hypothetical protein